MFNGSYLRACMKLRNVQKLDFPFLSLGRPSHGARVWRLGRVSHILSFRSQAVVSLFIFPIGMTALDSEPRGRRYVKNMGHNRNRLYSRAIHCPASMEKHYVQWFLLKSVQDITVCEKKLDFSFLSLGGPSHGPGFGVSVECQSIGTIGKKQMVVARTRGLVI